MGGAYARCPATHPETGQQCVRLAGTHEEHTTDHARDVYGLRWTDE